MKPKRAWSEVFRRRAQNVPCTSGSFRVARPRLFLSDRFVKLVEKTYLYRAYRTRTRSNTFYIRRPELHIWHSVKDIRKSWKKLHAVMLSSFYYPHIVVRYLHDHLYHKSKKYKRYHDHPATETVHRAALAGFVVSFMVFNLLQYGLPEVFDVFRAKEALASSYSKSWTTNADFNTGTTKSQISVSGTQGTDDATVSLSNLDNGLNFTSLSSGSQHSLAIKDNGTLWSWGSGGNGKLGHGGTPVYAVECDPEDCYNIYQGNLDKNTPTQVGSDTDWKMVNAGTHHSTAIKNDGTLWAWGWNANGQLGDGTTTDRTSPVQVGSATDWKTITGDYMTTLAIKNDGTLWAWGYNFYGQIGDGTTVDHNSPVQVGSATDWKTVSGQYASTSAIKNDGTLWSWGWNAFGQLGNGTTTSNDVKFTSPAQVGSATDWKALAARQYSSAAIKNNGTLWSWGSNANGQLGDGTIIDRNSPVQIGSATDWKTISGGQYNTSAIKNNGTLWSWGLNTSGQLGDGTTAQRQSPIQIGSATDWKIVMPGFTHSLAVKNNGTLWSWGANNTGQLGDGTTTGRTAPVQESAMATDWIGFSVPYLTPGTLSGLTTSQSQSARYAKGTIALTRALPTNTSVTMSVRAAEVPITNEPFYDITGVFQIPNTDSSCEAISLDPNRVCYQGNVVGAGGVALSGKYAEVKLVLISASGQRTPTVDGLSISYDILESPSNSDLTLTKTDGATFKDYSGGNINAGMPGAWSNSTAVRLTADNLTCIACKVTATNIRPEVEIKPVGTAFDSAGTLVATPGNNFVDATGLTAGTGYHIQVRAIDDQGRVSGWTSYGGNAESEADITIEQTAPVGTVSINSGAAYATSMSATLTSAATDAGGSGLAQMRFSNDGTTWSDWEAYVTTKSWTLTSGDGAKKVYAQYRDWAGNVSGQILDSAFTGSHSGTLKGNKNVMLLGLPTNYYGDISDGFIRNGGDSRIVTTGSTVSISSDFWTYGDSGFIRINSLPNQVVDSAKINIYFNNSAYFMMYNLQSDYNVLDVSDASISSSLIGEALSSPLGWKEIDVTSYVNANISAGKSYFALRLDPVEGQQESSYFASFESGNNKPYLAIAGDGPPYASSGTYVSSVLDSTVTGAKYGNFVATESKPTSTGITYQIRGGDTVTPDGTWTAYTAVASGTVIPVSVQGKRYLQYQATFTTTDSTKTPVLDDVFIEIANAVYDSITLDTAPPAAVSGLKIYTDSTKATQITDNTKWYTYTTPYFEWSANADADLKEYKYCFGTSFSCTPATTTNLVTNYTANLAAAADSARSFRVVAVDNAGNPSTPVSITYNFDKSLPGSVTGFAASSNDLTKITLSWNAFIAGQGAPLDSYKLERVKNTEYETNLWDMGSDWSTGAGYGVFILAESGYIDDSARIPDSGSTDPNLRQIAIETSVKYIYRVTVKDQSNAQYSAPVTATGLTRDGRAPDDITGVKSAACDGTITVIAGTSVPRCSDIANKGFEIALTWNVTTDVGTGVSKYYIYRATSAPDVLASFAKISETSAATNLYYDNDANNAANSTTPLNDFSTYYYRVTAIDSAGNESGLLPVLDPTQNSTSTTSLDVTAPTAPADVVATPMGLDGSDPTTAGGHQRVQITWSASSDTKARSAAAGSGVAGYKVFRADAEVGPFTDITTAANVTCDIANRVCTNDRLVGFTNYYYQVLAFDSAVPTANYSDLSLAVQVKTASDDVPGVPTGVTVNSLKGNPAQNIQVGHSATLSFVGSSDKIYQITNYEVYRATTNYASAADWLDPAKATKLKLNLDLNCGTRCYVSGTSGSDIDVTPIQDDRNSTYLIKDSGLTDATTYYYKVRAKDNTPTVPDGGPFYSGLSAISVGTPTVGWDITPDVTAPVIPVGGLEVKVRDTHPNEFELRNIITWKMLATDQLPMRNGESDFARYEIHREVVDPNTGAVVSDTNVGNVSTLGNNYMIDIIPIAFADLKYRYYVMVIDNAATDFKYSGGAVINAYSNNSAKEYWVDSIVPSKVRPVLNGAVTLTNVGVSSAIVSWTTDQEADSLVQFRVSGSSDNWIAIGQVERSVNHQVNLFGLKPNTQYEYQLVSRNYLGNVVEYDATVLPPLATSGFTITSGTVTTTTSTTEIAWETNLDASSAFVEYQLQRQPGDEPQGGTAGVDPSILSTSPKNHKVVLKGLRSARTYTYKIKSISKDGFLSEYPGSEFANFKTRSFDSAQFTLAPASSNVAERNITATTAQIVWQTENPTTSWVDYSTSSGTYDNASGNNDMVNTHVVVIEGLVPGTTYYYRVRVKDANEVEYTSKEYSFTAVLKPKLSNMTVKEVTPYSVTIAWDTNVDTETIINWGKTAGYGEKLGKSGTSKVHEITVNNLDDNQEYHYQILAKDSAGNEVADTDKVVRTPIDTVGPKISNVKVDALPIGENDSTASVIISWQTDKPATTLVEYDAGIIGGSYNNRSIEDAGLSSSHTVIVKELAPASSYHYRLISKDKRGNTTTSQDYTFVTPTKEKSILQLIIKSLEETFSWTRNLNQFFSAIGKRLSGKN